MKIFLDLCVKFLLRVVSLRSRQRTCKVVAILERSLDKGVLVQDNSAVRTVSCGIFVMGNSLFGGSRQVSTSLSTELGRSGVSYPLWYNSRVTYRDHMAIFTFIKRRCCQDKKRKDLVKIILKELYIFISIVVKRENWPHVGCNYSNFVSTSPRRSSWQILKK